MNLEKAVETTEFTDDTDEEAVALERVFTRLPIGGQARRASAEEVPALGDTGHYPCDPCDPWFLNCRI